MGDPKKVPQTVEPFFGPQSKVAQRNFRKLPYKTRKSPWKRRHNGRPTVLVKQQPATKVIRNLPSFGTVI